MTEKMNMNVDDWSKEYAAELKRVIASGIDYDWDADGLIDDDEIAFPSTPRRLTRM